jgi:L-ribulokinase
MNALALASRKAIAAAGVDGQAVEAIALDTTGSSVIPVDAGLEPIDDYYLWCDHRAWKEAAEITEAAHERGWRPSSGAAARILPSGASPSCCTGCATTRTSARGFVTALEHCDMVAAVLCGITDPAEGAAQHLRHGPQVDVERRAGRLPPEEFPGAVDPLLAGVREKLAGRYETSDQIAGHLTAEWAEKLGLRAGIPIPVGAFDAHWDAIGAGVQAGRRGQRGGHFDLHHGAQRGSGADAGRVRRGAPGRSIPNAPGIEAGLSATGDIFEAIARRAGTTVAALSRGWRITAPARPACCASPGTTATARCW